VRKYRPPNGASGDAFIEEWCEKCQHDDMENEILCPILTATFSFDVDDPRYPGQWCYDVNGHPVCISYKERR
jgi:hypothetical protein